MMSRRLQRTDRELVCLKPDEPAALAEVRQGSAATFPSSGCWASERKDAVLVDPRRPALWYSRQQTSHGNTVTFCSQRGNIVSLDNFLEAKISLFNTGDPSSPRAHYWVPESKKHHLNDDKHAFRSWTMWTLSMPVWGNNEQVFQKKCPIQIITRTTHDARFCPRKLTVCLLFVSFESFLMH